MFVEYSPYVVVLVLLGCLVAASPLIGAFGVAGGAGAIVLARRHG